MVGELRIGYTSAMTYSNQFRENGYSRSALAVDTTAAGMMRNRECAAPYSYPISTDHFGLELILHQVSSCVLQIMWRFKQFMPNVVNGLEGRSVDVNNLKVHVRNRARDTLVMLHHSPCKS